MLALTSQSCRRSDDIYARLDAKVSFVQADANNIVVRVTLTNQGTMTRLLPVWDLPPDGNLVRALFDVDRDGGRLQYTGRMLNSGDALREFVAIEPGKQQTVTIGLAQGYDVGPHGEYKIKYHPFWRSRSWLGGSRVFELNSNVLVVKK